MSTLAQPTFSLNRQAQVRGMTVGRESRVLIIDDVLAAPADVVEHAATWADFSAEGRHYYPGLTAAVKGNLISELLLRLRPALHSAYGVAPNAPLSATGYYSLVTRPQSDLLPLQTVPHVDDLNQVYLAMVLYLCDEKHGGTGFYRHRASGLESVQRDQAALYRQAVELTLSERQDRPPAYFQGSDEHYEQIGSVRARFNRLIVYNSNLLHSGLVNPDTLSADPRKGRLTVNLFVGPGSQ